MAYTKMKAEMKGDTSRWCRRAEAKKTSKKVRRTNDKKAIKEKA